MGIIIPTAEEADKFTKSKKIGILATQATVDSEAYVNEIAKINPEIKVFQQTCPLFVPIIESGEKGEKLDLVIKKYLNELFIKSEKIDAVILGCTHYAVIENEIKKYLPEKVKIVSQGGIIAEKLKNYFKKHPEIEKNLKKRKERIYLTTKDSEKIKKLAKDFFGEEIDIKLVKI